MPRIVRETSDRACFRILLRDAQREISDGTHWERAQLSIYEEVAKRGTVDLPLAVANSFCYDGVQLEDIHTLLCSIRTQAIREGASQTIPRPSWARTQTVRRRVAPPPPPAREETPSPPAREEPPRPAAPPPLVQGTVAGELGALG